MIPELPKNLIELKNLEGGVIRKKSSKILDNASIQNFNSVENKSLQITSQKSITPDYGDEINSQLKTLGLPEIEEFQNIAKEFLKHENYQATKGDYEKVLQFSIDNAELENASAIGVEFVVKNLPLESEIVAFAKDFEKGQLPSIQKELIDLQREVVQSELPSKIKESLVQSLIIKPSDNDEYIKLEDQNDSGVQNKDLESVVNAKVKEIQVHENKPTAEINKKSLTLKQVSKVQIEETVLNAQSIVEEVIVEGLSESSDMSSLNEAYASLEKIEFEEVEEELEGLDDESMKPLRGEEESLLSTSEIVDEKEIVAEDKINDQTKIESSENSKIKVDAEAMKILDGAHDNNVDIEIADFERKKNIEPILTDTENKEATIVEVISEDLKRKESEDASVEKSLDSELLNKSELQLRASEYEKTIETESLDPALSSGEPSEAFVETEEGVGAKKSVEEHQVDSSPEMVIRQNPDSQLQKAQPATSLEKLNIGSEVLPKERKIQGNHSFESVPANIELKQNSPHIINHKSGGERELLQSSLQSNFVDSKPEILPDSVQVPILKKDGIPVSDSPIEKRIDPLMRSQINPVAQRRINSYQKTVEKDHDFSPNHEALGIAKTEELSSHKVSGLTPSDFNKPLVVSSNDLNENEDRLKVTSDLEMKKVRPLVQRQDELKPSDVILEKDDRLVISSANAQNAGILDSSNNDFEESFASLKNKNDLASTNEPVASSDSIVDGPDPVVEKTPVGATDQSLKINDEVRHQKKKGLVGKEIFGADVERFSSAKRPYIKEETDLKDFEEKSVIKDKAPTFSHRRNVEQERLASVKVKKQTGLFGASEDVLVNKDSQLPNREFGIKNKESSASSVLKDSAEFHAKGYFKENLPSSLASNPEFLEKSAREGVLKKSDSLLFNARKETVGETNGSLVDKAPFLKDSEPKGAKASLGLERIGPDLSDSSKELKSLSLDSTENEDVLDFITKEVRDLKKSLLKFQESHRNQFEGLFKKGSLKESDVLNLLHSNMPEINAKEVAGAGGDVLEESGDIVLPRVTLKEKSSDFGVVSADDKQVPEINKFLEPKLNSSVKGRPYIPDSESGVRNGIEKINDLPDELIEVLEESELSEELIENIMGVLKEMPILIDGDKELLKLDKTGNPVSDLLDDSSFKNDRSVDPRVVLKAHSMAKEALMESIELVEKDLLERDPIFKALKRINHSLSRIESKLAMIHISDASNNGQDPVMRFDIQSSEIVNQKNGKMELYKNRGADKNQEVGSYSLNLEIELSQLGEVKAHLMTSKVNKKVDISFDDLEIKNIAEQNKEELEIALTKVGFPSFVTFLSRNDTGVQLDSSSTVRSSQALDSIA